MKMTYKTPDGRFIVEFEGSSDKDLWRQLSHFQELFEDNPAAKINGEVVSQDTYKFVVRKAQYEDEKGKQKTAEYFEKWVTSGPLAGYKKGFGVLDDGTEGLFPRKAPEDNSIYGYNNWYRYQKD